MRSRASMGEVWIGFLVTRGAGGPAWLSWGWPATVQASSRLRRPSTWCSATARESGSAVRCGSPGSTPATSSTCRWSRSTARCGAGQVVAPDEPAQEAQAGRQGDDRAGAHRHEPRQRGGVRPVGRRARAGADDPGGRVVVLRPDHRAGRAGAAGAEPPQPHDRRGPPDGRFRSGLGCGRSWRRSRTPRATSGT